MAYPIPLTIATRRREVAGGPHDSQQLVDASN
jgi:hypothetical protein